MTVEISTPKLQSLIDASNKNVVMIAGDLGVAQGTVWRWLKQPRKTGVSPRIFQRMLEVFEIDADELKANGHLAEPGLDPSFLDARPIPTWDIDVRASQWAHIPLCEVDTNDPEQQQVLISGRFRLRILGTCMEPDYPSGSVVEFRVLRIDREGMEPGRDYAVCRSDCMATFKRFSHRDEENVYLRALNQKEHPGELAVPHQEIVRVAVAESIVRPVKPGKVPKLKR